ncbi:MAG: alpha/beta hydrolase [Proteobacteria bacterium]|nr:alpha/beta hydrolase [Pseudomonadota bacterium]
MLSKLHTDRHTTQSSHSRHHGRPEMTPDEALIRALMAKQVGINSVVRQISYSGGFPVWTSRGTVIFLLQSNREGWAVAGDFNDWNPFPMTNIGHHLWVAELKIPKSIGQKLRYLYFLPNGESISDPLSLCFCDDFEDSCSFLKRPSRRQYLMRWNDFTSPQGLKSRPIHVLVPPNDGPYDVLYAHDGQNLFSKDSICGGWKLCERMREIGGNFLIVGIWNSPDRMSEYTHADDVYTDGGYYATLGHKYAAFVEETVRPFIESHFRTTARAGLMGSSLGGLISLYISNCYPGRYDSVFALSPTTAWGRLGRDNGTLIRDYYEKAGHQNTFLYIDHGGSFPTEGMPDILDRKAAIRDESDWASAYDNCCYTFDFVSALAEIGYRQSVDMFYQHIPGAPHNEDAWSARVSKPLRIFMEKRG